ncbi:ATP synthase subunit ATP5MPL, mitochondrial [Heterodontus francisci]|uniref:ATP synthase subunit ATP5MPL, mitochondrial n=1 Tax=Heterodontus francisci TaxID=7792 RepID=UPI00355B85A8
MEHQRQFAPLLLFPLVGAVRGASNEFVALVAFIPSVAVARTIELERWKELLTFFALKQRGSGYKPQTMAGRALAEWWFTMKPYAIAYRELWPSIAITAALFYKISYGGKKAVKDKSSSH